MLDLFTAKYPYTDYHELNLDWLISKVIAMTIKLDNFVSLNTIKYADPIGWDITKQYEANTVVLDQNTGIAYLSSQPVPAGVSLSNTDYWSVIFDLQQIIGHINNNITYHNDGTSPTCTFTLAVGDWVLWNGKLYKVLVPMSPGYAYIEGSNIEAHSVEELVKETLSALYLYIGDLTDLNTSDKSSIVNSINSLLADITLILGDLNDLTTTDKSSVVNAINELVSAITTLHNVIGNINDLNTSDTTNLVNAINSVLSDLTTIIGNLNDLTTTDKSSIVNAINELVTSVGGGYQALSDRIDQEVIDRTHADDTLRAEFNVLIQSLPWKNIKDYGAKASPQMLSSVYNTVAEAQVDYPFVTDLNWTFDSAALQKAINNHALIYIPEGNFYFNQYAEMTKTPGINLWIRGAGSRLTFCNISHDFLIYNRLNRTSACVTRISDMFIREVGSNVNQYRGIRYIGGYSGNNVTDHNGWTTVENVNFVDLKYAIDAVYTGQSVFEHLWFARCTTGFNFGRDVSFAKLINCIAEACGQFIQATDTLHDGLSNGLFFTNCQSIAATGHDFAIEGYQAVYFTNCSTDLLHTANKNGIWLLWCYDVSIQDCWIAGSAGVAGQIGVHLDNCHSVHIAGCSFSNYARAVLISNQGIVSLGLVSNITICENKFEANVVDILVEYGHFVVISDNTSITNTTTVISMSNSDYNVISNNIMYGSMTPNAGANSLVTNNMQNAR